MMPQKVLAQMDKVPGCCCLDADHVTDPFFNSPLKMAAIWKSRFLLGWRWAAPGAAKALLSGPEQVGSSRARPALSQWSWFLSANAHQWLLG